MYSFYSVLYSPLVNLPCDQISSTYLIFFIASGWSYVRRLCGRQPEGDSSSSFRKTVVIGVCDWWSCARDESTREIGKHLECCSFHILSVFWYLKYEWSRAIWSISSKSWYLVSTLLIVIFGRKFAVFYLIVSYIYIHTMIGNFAYNPPFFFCPICLMILSSESTFCYCRWDYSAFLSLLDVLLSTCRPIILFKPSKRYLLSFIIVLSLIRLRAF